MGIKLKQSGLIKSDASLVPGPGAYPNTAEYIKNKAPAFCFARSKRPPLSGAKAKECAPGPGSYKLLTKFANVPDYALPSVKPENKFV